MNEVEAIIEPLKLHRVKGAPQAAGLQGGAVTAAKGCDRRNGQSGLSHGAPSVVDLLPEAKVEIVLAGDVLDCADAAVRKAAKARRDGGGIFMADVDGAIRLRTGETSAAPVPDPGSPRPTRSPRDHQEEKGKGRHST
jgi:nitrogen regulatory protein P-II 1